MKTWTMLLLAAAIGHAYAANPSYDAATGRLDLPEVDIGAQTFSKVVLHLGVDGRYELLSFVSPQSVSAAENGQTVQLSVGQYLEVKLAANYSTGFAWQFDPQSIAILSQQGEPTYVSDSDLPISGGGGVVTWKFKAVQAGAGTLRLDYRRSWEAGDPAATVLYPIIVE